MKLGTLLLRDAIISLNQLETALRTQVLYGGKLGTNLVELGFVDLDTLGNYLADVLGVPHATGEQLDAVDPAVIATFGGELADLYTAIPLGFLADRANAMLIALAEPRDDMSIEALATQCGYAVIPFVAPQLRILYYLEKYYGLVRKARYVRTGTTRAQQRQDDGDRRRQQAPGGMELPPTVTFAPKSKQPDSKKTKRPAAPMSYREACDAIDAAEHRNQIGDALVEFATGRFEVAVVFLLRDSNALGWRMYTATGTGSHDAIEALGLPLGGASVLQAAYDSGVPFRGQSPTPGRPIEKRLWEALGTPKEPSEVLVVPVLVKQRVVNLVYAHGFDGEAMSDEHADELSELAVRASHAYMRLIQAAKDAARSEPT
jgi:hypothetical protein